MYLTSANLGVWLIQRGLLDPDAITTGKFAVQELEHHNRGFYVYRPTDRPLYVKQLREFDRPNIDCLRREAEFGDVLSKSGSTHWLSSRIPELLDYDARHNAVTVRLISGTETLHECVERSLEVPDRLTFELGKLVATFKSPECDAILSSMASESIREKTPWILSFHTDQGAGSLSPLNQQFLKRLQNDSLLVSNLDGIRNAWHAKSMMHGDLKWNNVLFRSGTDSNPEWFIIDWEMLDRGDPLWDLATMIQCWWSFWILSTPPDRLTEFDNFRVNRKAAFEETRSSMDMLWLGYCEESKLDGPSCDDCLERLMRMSAARLLQTVYEMLNTVNVASEYIDLMIEMSRRVLASPESMAEFSPGTTRDVV